MKTCCNPEHGQLNPQVAKFVLDRRLWVTWVKSEPTFLCIACAWVWNDLGHLDRDHYSLDAIEEWEEYQLPDVEEEDDPSIVNPFIGDDEANRIANTVDHCPDCYPVEKEVEYAYRVEKRYGKKLKWDKWVKCDVCGKKNAALCFDDIYRCIGCIDRAFPEGSERECLT